MDHAERAALDAAAFLLEEQLNAKIAPNQPPTIYDPACDNQAVARCCYAYIDKLREENKLGSDRVTCLDSAQRAYCNALPPLNGTENVRDFIACIAHGILIDAIDGRKSTRLLYAAQVADGAQRKMTIPSRSGRPVAEAKR